MAESASRASPALLLRLRKGAHCWGDIYRGTRDELIAAGLARDGMFPGDPGMNKVSQKHAGPPAIKIVRVTKAEFEVKVCADAEEQARRWERERCERNLERATDEQERELQSMPVSADDFRGRAAQASEELARLFRGNLQRFGHGYRFDADTLHTFDWALAEATRALENGRVVFDAAERQRRIVEIRQRVAAVDPTFQSFLAATR